MQRFERDPADHDLVCIFQMTVLDTADNLEVTTRTVVIEWNEFQAVKLAFQVQSILTFFVTDFTEENNINLTLDR